MEEEVSGDPGVGETVGSGGKVYRNKDVPEYSKMNNNEETTI